MMLRVTFHNDLKEVLHTLDWQELELEREKEIEEKEKEEKER